MKFLREVKEYSKMLDEYNIRGVVKFLDLIIYALAYIADKLEKN